MSVAGYAAEALSALTPSQLAFIQQLPKAELHAHLNGCIPISTLQHLAKDHLYSATPSSTSQAVKESLERLTSGVTLNEIHEFFSLFPAIYELTATPESLAVATRDVLDLFLSANPDRNGGYPQASYLELRSTPKETPRMSRLEYIETVCNEVERYDREGDRAAVIVSLDRRMTDEVAREVVECAIKLKKAGRRVVGVDLCGDPLAGDMDSFAKHFQAAKEAGLGVTLHIAETPDNPVPETLRLLSFKPDRLGHATFLGSEEKNFVHNSRMCVEICLSSNLLCKTVKSLDEHHIRHYLKHDHPVVVCTDDTLPFKNSLVGEYALLMAPAPIGLGLSEQEVERIAKMGMDSRFRSS
ncbi:Adenosine/adenine deaminase [Abortiporus biennis]